MNTVIVTNIERDDIADALECRKANLIARISTQDGIIRYTSHEHSRSQAMSIKSDALDRIERINNLLQGKFLCL